MLVASGMADTALAGAKQHSEALLWSAPGELQLGECLGVCFSNIFLSSAGAGLQPKEITTTVTKGI